MQDKRVGVVSRRGKYYPVDIGQIIIPYNVDRDKFVKECLSTGFVSVQPQVNNPIHRVRCDKSVLQNLTFPDDSSTLGSYVVYVNLPKHKHPIIVACIDSVIEYGDLKENQFKLFRQTDFGSVGIVGDGKGGLTITVNSERTKQGRIDVNLSNPDNTTQFNIITKGTFNLSSTDKLSIVSDNELDLKVTDGDNESSFNITPSQIKAVSELISHNEGSEPMLLGQSTVDLLREFINLVATATNAGGPLSTSAQISQLATQLDALLSEKSKLD